MIGYLAYRLIFTFREWRLYVKTKMLDVESFLHKRQSKNHQFLQVPNVRGDYCTFYLTLYLLQLGAPCPLLNAFIDKQISKHHKQRAQ